MSFHITYFPLVTESLGVDLTPLSCLVLQHVFWQDKLGGGTFRFETVCKVELIVMVLHLFGFDVVDSFVALTVAYISQTRI